MFLCCLLKNIWDFFAFSDILITHSFARKKIGLILQIKFWIYKHTGEKIFKICVYDTNILKRRFKFIFLLSKNCSCKMADFKKILETWLRREWDIGSASY